MKCKEEKFSNHVIGVATIGTLCLPQRLLPTGKQLFVHVCDQFSQGSIASEISMAGQFPVKVTR